MRREIAFLLFAAFIADRATAQTSSILVESGAAVSVGMYADVCADSKIILGTLDGAGTWCFGVLPVELVSFTARSTHAGLILQWTTHTETRNYGFEIERRPIVVNSQTRSPWETIAFIAGRGTSAVPHEYEYEDRVVAQGRYAYRLRQIDNSGDFSYSQEIESEYMTVPHTFTLEQNFPNPFNPATTIRFWLPQDGAARVELLDQLGRSIRLLFAGSVRRAEPHTILLDGSHLASGTYFARLTWNNAQQLRRLVLLK